MDVVSSVQTALYCWHISDDVFGHCHSSREERYSNFVTVSTIFQFGTNNLIEVVKGFWALPRMLWSVYQCLSPYKRTLCYFWRLMFLVFAVTNADIACTYTSFPMYPFAFRTHTHSLGEILHFLCIYLLYLLSSLRILFLLFMVMETCCISCASGKVVSGYRVRNGQWTQIGRQSPLLPQVRLTSPLCLVEHDGLLCDT